jgi:hypothetical protein
MQARKNDRAGFFQPLFSVRQHNRACTKRTMIGTLAAAYAEAGRFSEAITTAERAMKLATTQKNSAMIDALQIQIKSYKAGFPFRECAQSNITKK